MQPTWPTSESAVSRPKYVGRIVPLHFPESADVPESQLHLDLRTLLYQLLSAHLGESVTVGSDELVYLDGSNPKRCIAPDVFAKAVPRGERIASWKLWERAAPDLAIEIVSESDVSDASWEEKLALYRALGVTELVRFDPISGNAPLRIWHRTQEVLAERVITEDEDAHDIAAASMVFDLFWVVAPAHGMKSALRIATSLTPLALVPADAEGREAERQAKDLQRAVTEAERKATEVERRGKEAAEARVRELEALLQAKDETR